MGYTRTSRSGVQAEDVAREWHIPLISIKEGSQQEDDNVGTSYVEMNSRFRQTIDFSKIPANQIRLMGKSQGNEAGTPKGIELYDSTNAQQLCEHTWGGSGVEDLDSGWTALPSSLIGSATPIVIHVRVKASSVTEDLDTFALFLMLRRA